MIINENYFKDNITNDEIIADAESITSYNDTDYLQSDNPQYPYTLAVAFLTDNKSTIKDDISSQFLDNILKYIISSLDSCPFISEYYKPLSCVMCPLTEIYNKLDFKQHLVEESSIIPFYDYKFYHSNLYIRNIFIIRFNSVINTVSRLFTIFKFIKKPFMKTDNLSVSLTIHSNITYPIYRLLDYKFITELKFNNGKIGMYELGQIQYLSEIAEECNIPGHIWSDSVKQYKIDFETIQFKVLKEYAKDNNNWFAISDKPINTFDMNYTDWKELLSSEFATPNVFTCPRLNHIKNNKILPHFKINIDDIVNNSKSYTIWTSTTKDNNINAYYIWIDRTNFITVDDVDTECCLFYSISQPGWIEHSKEEDEYYKKIQNLFNE